MGITLHNGIRYYASSGEDIYSKVRRIEPWVELTDSEIDAILVDARQAADQAMAGKPESAGHRAYQVAYAIFKRKQALAAEASLQDESWRGCVASYISDSI